MVVTPNDGFAYLSALGDRVLAVGQLGELVEAYGQDRTRPIALIDFDSATFTSAFFDQALEDEVGPGWTSSYSDPMTVSPSELQKIWPPFE